MLRKRQRKVAKRRNRAKRAKRPATFRVAQKAKLGRYLIGDSARILESAVGKRLAGKVNLIITSPPFPLNNKKSYGNLQGDEYLEWFSNLAGVFSKLLADDGSLVIEVGNSWEPGRPVQSMLPLRSLLSLIDNKDAGLRLIQEFVCYNPSRLPSPAQWVTVNRFRTVDSYTHVWWLAKTDFPKATNTKVLRPYSESMQQLLKRGSFNSGNRPSEHRISEAAFLTDHGGSIPHNFFELDPLETTRKVRLPNAFSLSNTASNDFFHRECQRLKLKLHPARMQAGLVEFFIQFLTDKNDLVFDPFAGSNTTGFVAAKTGRRWAVVDIEKKYVRQSRIRFKDPVLSKRRK